MEYWRNGFSRHVVSVEKRVQLPYTPLLTLWVLLGHDLNKINKCEYPNFTFVIYQWQLLGNWFWDTDNFMVLSNNWLVHRPFKAVIRVRVPAAPLKRMLRV